MKSKIYLKSILYMIYILLFIITMIKLYSFFFLQEYGGEERGLVDEYPRPYFHNQTLQFKPANAPPFFVSMNSEGFRDINHVLEKTNGTVRIACLGDSFTFGGGLEFNETYPKILERKLNEKSKKYKYEIINLGIVGFNTLDNLNTIKTVGLKYNPDIIILQYLSDNDHTPQEKLILTPFTMNLLRFINNYLDSKFSKYLYMQLKIRKQGKYKLNPKDFKYIVETPLNELGSIAKENNIKVIILLYRYNKNQYPLLNQIIKNNNFGLIDTNLITGKNKDKELWLTDGHPNSFFNALVSEALHEPINDLYPNQNSKESLIK